MTTVTESNVWVERARSLAPMIEQYRDESEQLPQRQRPVVKSQT